MIDCSELLSSTTLSTKSLFLDVWRMMTPHIRRKRIIRRGSHLAVATVVADGIVIKVVAAVVVVDAAVI